jgi:hypothetical protein
VATRFLFANNARTTLAAGIDDTDTVITVATGTGALFPSPGAGEQFAVTLVDAPTGTINEICYCTSRTTDALTVVRGREGTTAVSWPSGSTVANFVTRDTLAQFNQQGVAGSSDYWVAGGSADTITVTPSPAYTAYFTGLTIDLGVGSNNTGAATLNVNGLGAKDIRDQNGVALTADMLLAGRIQRLVYQGTYFKMVAAVPPASFIDTLTPRSPLQLTDKIAVDGGSGAQEGTLSQVAALLGAANAAEMFFLGLI